MKLCFQCGKRHKYKQFMLLNNLFSRSVRQCTNIDSLLADYLRRVPLYVLFINPVFEHIIS